MNTLPSQQNYAASAEGPRMVIHTRPSPALPAGGRARLSPEETVRNQPRAAAQRQQLPNTSADASVRLAQAHCTQCVSVAGAQREANGNSPTRICVNEQSQCNIWSKPHVPPWRLRNSVPDKTPSQRREAGVRKVLAHQRFGYIFHREATQPSEIVL